MSYLNYVIAAYAVFVVVLLWDFVATAPADRAANCAPRRLRAAREARAATRPPDQRAEPMNPIRQRRLLLGRSRWSSPPRIAAALVAMALQRNVTYLYTPAEVLRGRSRPPAGALPPRRHGRGQDSFQRAPGSLEAHFRVDRRRCADAGASTPASCPTCSARSRR